MNTNYLKKLEENNATYYKHLADLETINSELKDKIFKIEYPYLITSQEIQAKTRKLKVIWATDTAQEFININPCDIEREIINDIERESTKLSLGGYIFDTKAHPNLIIPTVKGQK